MEPPAGGGGCDSSGLRGAGGRGQDTAIRRSIRTASRGFMMMTVFEDFEEVSGC
jgi:hypothetical protein